MPFKDVNKRREAKRKSYRKHRVALLAYRKEWRLRNKERQAENVRRWGFQNPEKCREITAKRRAARVFATPKWLTSEHRRQLRQIYALCPKGMEVDHIIPLQGKGVVGLHVPWNLQYLSIRENRAKGNRVCG